MKYKLRVDFSTDLDCRTPSRIRYNEILRTIQDTANVQMVACFYVLEVGCIDFISTQEQQDFIFTKLSQAYPDVEFSVQEDNSGNCALPYTDRPLIPIAQVPQNSLFNLGDPCVIETSDPAIEMSLLDEQVSRIKGLLPQ